MGLHSPAERDPLGGHLQRADHRRADPAGPPRGARTAPRRRRALLRRNLLVYGLGGLWSCRSRASSSSTSLLGAIGRCDHDEDVLRPALALLALFTVLLGLAYPALVTGVAQRRRSRRGERQPARPERADGGLGARSGSRSRDPGYFWGRPSATAPTPTTRAPRRLEPRPLEPRPARARSRRVVAALRAADPGNAAPVPVDLVTPRPAGSTPTSRRRRRCFQVGAGRAARGAPGGGGARLVDEHDRGRALGFFGEPRVNVLLPEPRPGRLARAGCTVMPGRHDESGP